MLIWNDNLQHSVWKGKKEMKSYKHEPYSLTINDDAAPLITLYDGREVVECIELRSSELPIDGCQRIINKYLKHKLYYRYIHICRCIEAETDKNKVDAKSDEVWLEFLKTPQAIRVRELLEIARKDLGI